MITETKIFKVGENYKTSMSIFVILKKKGFMWDRCHSNCMYFAIELLALLHSILIVEINKLAGRLITSAICEAVVHNKVTQIKTKCARHVRARTHTCIKHLPH